MKRRPRNSRWVAWTLLGLISTAFALEPNDWRNRQALALDRAGLTKITLPPETLDAARANLEDLRLIDSAGREVPFHLERTTRPQGSPIRTGPMRVTLTRDTEIYIEVIRGQFVDAVMLNSPAPTFLKAARVEVSGDGGEWRVIQSGIPLFRRFGTEQLRVDLPRRTTGNIRITLDDSRSPAIPITGAVMIPSTDEVPDSSLPLPTRSIRREEFSGETVFTIDLGFRHVPLAAIEFSTNDPLFARRVTVGVRELRDEVATERTLATGSIYRVAVEGLPARAQLEVPLEFSVASRELLVHVANGDSPPLTFDELKLRQRPVRILFLAPEAGAYTLLTGNSQIAAPRYDVAGMNTALRNTPVSDLAFGPLAANPNYRQPDALANTPIHGAPLDPAAWSHRKAVQLKTAGVQELELDLDVLARAQHGFGDLRLLRGGDQVPYLLERPALTRSSPLTFAPMPTPGRPRTTRWEIKLPRTGLPLERLTLASPTGLFQRELHLFETVSDSRSGNFDRTLAVAPWNHAPGNTPNLVVTLTAPPSTNTLYLETDNGDNQPIALGSVTAALPVTRLLFKVDAAPGTESTTPLALYYGHQAVAPPRYDLALVSAQILAAEKSIATLGAEEAAQAGGWASKALSGLQGGPLLWGVLALVVVVLLVVVAKLLPKPPGAAG